MTAQTLSTWWIIAVFLLLGLIAGSFLNVCVYRIPRSESIVFPPSRCPDCGHRLAAWELIPVLSFVLLRGRCRECGGRIPAQYPLVELGTGIMFALIYLAYGFSPGLAGRLVLASALLAVSLIDIYHYRIPNRIVLFIAAAGVALNLWTGEVSWLYALSGALVGGGTLLAVALLATAMLKQQGMGEGDIKLCAATGLYLGPLNQAVAIFLAAFTGAVIGGIFILWGRKKKRDPIPFGPFLALGTMIAYLWGHQLWMAYKSLFGLQ